LIILALFDINGNTITPCPTQTTLLAVQMKATMKIAKTSLHEISADITIFEEDGHHFGEFSIGCHTKHDIDAADPEEQLVDNTFGHDMKGIDSLLSGIQTGRRAYTLQFDSLPNYDNDEEYCREEKISNDKILAAPGEEYGAMSICAESDSFMDDEPKYEEVGPCSNMNACLELGQFVPSSIGRSYGCTLHSENKYSEQPVDKNNIKPIMVVDSSTGMKMETFTSLVADILDEGDNGQPVAVIKGSWGCSALKENHC
jgi:hypothetical protein